ncbi:hypothetical protein D3C81_1361030 [compost metagenome]
MGGAGCGTGAEADAAEAAATALAVDCPGAGRAICGGGATASTGRSSACTVRLACGAVGLNRRGLMRSPSISRWVNGTLPKGVRSMPARARMRSPVASASARRASSAPLAVADTANDSSCQRPSSSASADSANGACPAICALACSVPYGVTSLSTTTRWRMPSEWSAPERSENTCGVAVAGGPCSSDSSAIVSVSTSMASGSSSDFGICAGPVSGVGADGGRRTSILPRRSHSTCSRAGDHVALHRLSILSMLTRVSPLA